MERGRGRMLPLLALHAASEYYRLERKPPVTAALLVANTLIYLRPGFLHSILPSIDQVWFNPHLILRRYLDFECCLICLKCTNCSAEIWIRSDPENRDYFVESGATKKRQAAVSKKRKREAEEGGDALKSLEI